MKPQLVLDLFPGGGLLGAAFAEVGFTVVRGPEIMFGDDVRTFHVPPGRFDGIIGGPPCQVHSRAAVTGTKSIDMIPDFLRIVDEAQPAWVVMENVPPARHADSAPDWEYVMLRDWDCGGHTHRQRVFWFYGLPAPMPPVKRPGEPRYTVLATSWKQRINDKTPDDRRSQLSQVHWKDAAWLQGWEYRAQTIMAHKPTAHSSPAWASYCVHLLGNGVPRAMGLYVARHVALHLDGASSAHMTGLPLFSQLGGGYG